MGPLPLLLLTLAAGASAPPTGRKIGSLAAPAFALVNVDAKVGDFLLEDLARHVRAQGIKVVTANEIATILGQERQRQLLGCSDAETNACMAELGNALGTEGLLMGHLARFGTTFLLNLKVLEANKTSVVAEFSLRAADEGNLLEQLAEAAEKIAARLLLQTPGQRGGVPPTATVSSSPSVRSRAWIPAAAGLVLAGAGGVFWGLASGRRAELERAQPGLPLGLDASTRLRDEGKRFQTLSLVGLGLGAAGLAVAGGMFALGSPAGDSRVAVIPRHDGAGLIFSFP